MKRTSSCKVIFVLSFFFLAKSVSSVSVSVAQTPPFFWFSVSKNWTIIVCSWVRSNQPSCVWFTASPTAWQLQRKHLFTWNWPLHLRYLFPKQELNLITDVALSLRHFIIPESHVDSLTERVSDSRSSAEPFDHEAIKSEAISADRLPSSVELLSPRPSLTGVLLPWQPRSAFYAPVVDAVELGPKTCQCLGASSRGTWSR